MNAFRQRYCPRCRSYFHKKKRREHLTCEPPKYPAGGGWDGGGTEYGDWWPDVSIDAGMG